LIPDFVINVTASISTIQACVSAASLSESLNFEINAALYRRFRQASAILAQTDREDLRTWSTREYLSSGGNERVMPKIIIAASMAF
jgi:hypothetical protein